jgi:hypothetical protein
MGAVDCVRDLINKGPEEAREDATIAMAAIARHLEAMDPALDELIGLVATGEDNDDLFEAFRKEFEPTYYNPVKPGSRPRRRCLLRYAVLVPVPRGQVPVLSSGNTHGNKAKQKPARTPRLLPTLLSS